MKLAKLSSALLLLSASTIAFSSDWSIDNSHSELHFISVKKGSIAEVHQFKKLSGTLDSKGDFELSIDLASVDTMNPVRDARMTKFLFETTKFSNATLSAKLDPAELDAIAEGADKRLSIDAKLNLHGVTKTVPLDIIVTRLVGARFSAVSATPIILNVGDFALTEGVDKLRELASLPSISYAVPVTFHLTLKLNK